MLVSVTLLLKNAEFWRISKRVCCYLPYFVLKLHSLGETSKSIEISFNMEYDIFSHNFARKGLQKTFICSKLWSKVMSRFPSISDIDIYIG